MTTTTPTPVDLTADREWLELAPAGAEVTVRMAVLHVDDARGTRTVLVRFPDGWSRALVGSQPAGEEMVILSGALSVSGRAAAAGEYLVVEPRATRSHTSVADGTSAVVFFSGPGGGWVEGPWEGGGSIEVTRLEPGVVRAEREGLNGSTEVVEDIVGRSFETDTDLVWLASRRWLHLPAGVAAPDVDGRCLVRHWA